MAILAIVGCKTNDAEPFSPEEGSWVVGDLVATSNTCGELFEDDDEVGGLGLTLSLADGGFTLSEDESVWTCALTARDFNCTDVNDAFDFSDEGEEALFSQNRAYSGTFASSTEATLNMGYVFDCEGADCDVYAAWLETSLPCEMKGYASMSRGTTGGSDDDGTALSYAHECEQELGAVPGFDCTEGTLVPITVDGVAVDEDQSGAACDAPSIAEGDCNVGTRVGRIGGTDSNGEARDDVVWAYLCRKYDGIVQLIGTHTETGATCFFESEWDVVEHSDALSIEDGLVVGPVPSPTDADYEAVWKAPGEVAGQYCWSCHMADPYIHTPYIDGARLPEDPSQPVIPNVADADSLYYLVGEAFSARVEASGGLNTLHIEDNACLTCHRFVDPGEFSFQGGPQFDPNTTMPPDEPGSLSADLEALLACADAGPGNTPGCEWRAVPGSEE